MAHVEIRDSYDGRDHVHSGRLCRLHNSRLRQYERGQIRTSFCICIRSGIRGHRLPRRLGEDKEQTESRASRQYEISAPACSSHSIYSDNAQNGLS